MVEWVSRLIGRTCPSRNSAHIFEVEPRAAVAFYVDFLALLALERKHVLSFMSGIAVRQLPSLVQLLLRLQLAILFTTVSFTGCRDRRMLAFPTYVFSSKDRQSPAINFIRASFKNHENARGWMKEEGRSIPIAVAALICQCIPFALLSQAELYAELFSHGSCSVFDLFEYLW